MFQRLNLLLLLTLIMGLARATSVEAGAVPIKTSGPIDRDTVWTSMWCPSTKPGMQFFDGEFTADGPNATFVFRGRIESISSGPYYMRVSLDNVRQ